MVRVETNLVNTVFTAVDRDRHFITTLRADDLRFSRTTLPRKSVSLSGRLTDRSRWRFWSIPANRRNALSQTKRRPRKHLSNLL